jgi:hypothetical protein
VVTDALSAERINLHRTWLAADGSGKADIPKPRLFLKHHRKHGGVIRLFPDEELTTGLCVAEGWRRRSRPPWASGRSGRPSTLATSPPSRSCPVSSASPSSPTTTWPDRRDRRAGLAAAETCTARWLEAGREVRVWRAAAEGEDLNDLARRAAA